VRDGVLVVRAVARVGVVAGFELARSDPPPAATPNATFEATNLDDDTVVVEHAGGAPVDADAVWILVPEERRLLPDRTVPGSTWAAHGRIRQGDRRRLEDPRFEPGQRLIVRWFGHDGQATLSEGRL